MFSLCPVSLIDAQHQAANLSFPPQKGGAKPSPPASNPNPRYDSQPSPRYDSKPPPPRPTELAHRPSDHRTASGGGRLSPGHPPPGQGGRQQPVDPRYAMSPPPTATGPRPSGHGSRPAPISKPPPSPGPTDGAADPTLLPLFRAVDKDGQFLFNMFLLTRGELADKLANYTLPKTQAQASSPRRNSPPPSSTATGRPSTRRRCA